jgi:hypothetical protein
MLGPYAELVSRQDRLPMLDHTSPIRPEYLAKM